jgi:serine/threonine protein kinase/alpha-tubulin suppressor-like RCC1 family protein
VTSKLRTPTALKGEYEILRELGRGGTSVVYLARELATGDEVAIKQIRAKYIEDEEAVARFAREARFVAQLSHPNIIPVRRVVDLKRGGVALVMDHVPGRTLRDLIRETGSLPPDRAEQIIRDIAAALDVAHGMGIVHRDVKPENVFVDDTGRAMLADFGLARAMDGDTQLTMAGVAIGTPAYMAPEQIDGNDLDARGDIYSLGLVAWEMLTGKRPWEGETLYAILYRQKYEQLPDVRDMRPDVPGRLANAIAVAIEKNRDSRWQTVSAFVEALDHESAAVERRVVPRTPVTTETVRFARPVTPAVATPPTVTPLAPVTPISSPPVAMPVADALASVAAELAAGGQPATGGSGRRTLMVVGSLATLAAVALIAAAAQHRSRPQTPPPPMVVQASSPGNVESPVQPPAATRRADSVPAIGPSLAVASPSREPAAPLQLTPAEESPLRDTSAVADSSDASRQASPAKSATQQAVPAPKPVSKTGTSQPPQPAAPSTAPAPPPTAPSIGARATVIAGGMHTCFVSADGKVFCWGANDRGQLGNGGTTRSASPSVVAIDLRFSVMAAGLSHSCAIARGGSVWCWGANDHGQLGDRTTAQHSMPARVAATRSFTAITVGAAHSCALDDSGGAWCWGSNEQGQLGAFGSDATAESATPLAVAWRGRFAAIAAGWNFTCALEISGRAMCWGDGGNGQLGDGGTSDRHAPVWVSTDRTFTSIAAGNGHTCGVTPQGEAYCWGRNNGGQLGDGSRTDRATPVRVKSTEHFVSIAAGAVHTCALTVAGEAYCWGRNNYGQLGDGGAGDQTAPVAVAGAHTFASLRAFGSHTCGTTTSGEAFCWGYNLEGQLGDGTRIHRTRPVYVEPPGGG